MAANDTAKFPDKFQFLFRPKRYKVAFGGRGGAKSWAFARALLILAAQKKLRILCARETQKSIADSVYKLLCDQIKDLGLENFYSITKISIIGLNGSEFGFAGIRQSSVADIKSFEGCDICWVEEAQVVSHHSWEILIPTIRKPDSEIWASFNPELETDETYKRFVINPPSADMAEVVNINWRDNPWFPAILRREMEDLKARDPDSYEHVYEGICKQVVEGAVYRNELIAAEKEGRICKVPCDRTKPVQTFWDLGFGDMTCIWFVQAIGFEFRLIDYMDGAQQSLGYYLKALQDKGYIYGTDYLPHDAVQKQFAAGGRSILDQMQAAGRRVHIVPRGSIETRIVAARTIFNRCVFDATNCADGLQALRHYRYESDEKLGTLKKQPLHDWASHGSDAFGAFAVAIREPERQKAAKAQQARPVSAWG